MDRDIWRTFQRLSLGSDQAPIQLQAETRRQTSQNSDRSLIARCLNPQHHRARCLKNTLPAAWRMEGKVSSQINDDGIVQFFFNSKHHLLTVLGGPWSFREWMVVIDRWTNRRLPRYLQDITFWNHIFNLPNEHRNIQTVLDIGFQLGRAKEVTIKEPTNNNPAEVRVKITMDIHRKLIFTRYLDLQDGGEPILFRFVYDKLRKCCRRCGSLAHDNSVCQEIIVQPILPIIEFQYPPAMDTADFDDFIDRDEEMAQN